MKILSIFLLILLGCIEVSGFSVDSCRLYHINNSSLLGEYLEKNNRHLSAVDKMYHMLYTAYWYGVQEDDEKHLKYLTDGYLYCIEKGGPDSIKWHYLDELALTYLDDASVDKKKSLEYISESIKIKASAPATLEEIGKSMMIKGEALSHIHLDSAYHYYHLACDYLFDEESRMMVQFEKASINIQRNRLDSIETKLEKVLNYYRTKNPKRKVEALGLLAEYHLASGHPLEAKVILDTLYHRVKTKEWPQIYEQVLGLNIALYTKLKDYKQVVDWKDSLSDYTSRKRELAFEEIEENYKLKTELTLAKAKSRKYKLWKGIFVSGFGGLCMVLFGLYKYLEIKRRAAEQKLEAMLVRSALDATKAKMQGEQFERENIAAVLHDQVASLLTAASMQLMMATMEEEKNDTLEVAGEIIKEVNYHVRDLSHQLVSPTLMKYGLEAGLKAMCQRLQTDKLFIFFTSSGAADRRFPDIIESFLYQAASELIQNAIKHSNGNTCELNLSLVDGVIKLGVLDNGFIEVPGEVFNKDGLGLIHIKKRSEALDGSFTFLSSCKGTEATITLPSEVVLSEIDSLVDRPT